MKAIRLVLVVLLLVGCDARFEFDKPIASDFVACTTRCAQWGQYCADEWNVCVECNGDDECKAKDPNQPRCSDDHRCVQCRSYVDCARLGAGYDCVSPDFQCAPRCSYGDGDDDDVCALASLRCGDLGVCIECERDSECSGGRCLACGYCAQCKTNADCPSNVPICDPVLHACMQCSDGRQCASGCCNLQTHQCY